MCGKELVGIFHPSGNEWIVKQMYSNFTACLRRNNGKCKDGRLQENTFSEFGNKGFRKQIKLDLSRHPDRFRNRLVQMNNDDTYYLWYQMNTYHHMYVVEITQRKPVDHPIHVRFNLESIKSLGTGSHDYSAYRVKRLIVPTPTLSNFSQPEMNFRTDPNDETFTNYTTSTVENTSLKVMSTKSPLENSTPNSTDIPNRTSNYHDQVETSDKGKRELAATNTTPKLPPDHKTETTNDTDHGKVRESDLSILRSVRKEESTSAVLKPAENHAQGKLAARKVDPTSDVTDISLQSDLTAEIAQVEVTSDGGEIRERGIPISNFVIKEGSTTNVIMELADNHMLGNISAQKEASDKASNTTDNPLSSVSSALKTVIVQIENSSNDGKIRERGIPISRSVTKEGSTTKITELSENKRDSLSITAGTSHSTEGSDYGKVKERGIPSSRLVTDESSPTTGTKQMNKTRSYLSSLQRNGTKRNAVHKLVYRDKRPEDGDDYADIDIDMMYRDGKVNEEEEYLVSPRAESHSTNLSSRASSQEFHPTLILLTFILRLFSALTSDDAY